MFESHKSSITCTRSDCRSKSWLDHVLVSEGFLHRVAGTKSVKSSVNPSDHWLLLTELEIKKPKTVKMSCDKRINWSTPDVVKILRKPCALIRAN